MKVKDLVKGRTYNIFDYKSFFGFPFWLNDDNCFVPAVYLGRLDGNYLFDGLNNYDIYRYRAAEIHVGQVKEVKENECV